MKTKLEFTLEGEVAPIVFHFGHYCGMGNPGIGIDIKGTKTKRTDRYGFDSRGGVLTKENAVKLRNFLNLWIKYMCDGRIGNELLELWAMKDKEV